MSTLIVEVDAEQERVLETLLAYMDVAYQKVTATNDFWNELTPIQQQHIQDGMADAKAGRYSPAKTILAELNNP